MSKQFFVLMLLFIHNVMLRIGSSLLALFAGKIPKTIPIKAEKRRLPIATLNEIDGFIISHIAIKNACQTSCQT